MSVSTPIIVPKGNENESRIAQTIAKARPHDFPLINPIPAATDKLTYASSTVKAMLKPKSAPIVVCSIAPGKANTAMAMIPIDAKNAVINLQISIGKSK